MALLRSLTRRNSIQLCSNILKKQEVRSLSGVTYVKMKYLKKTRSLCSQEFNVLASSQGRLYCSAGNGDNVACKKKTEISYGELLDLLDTGDIQLFDVREPKELEETGRIPNSTNLPLSKMKAALEMTPEEFYENFGIDQPSKTDTNIVFYGLCDIKGSTAVQIARKGGYKHARHYPGGFDEWNHKQKATG